MPDSRTLWTAVVIICIAVSVFFSVKKRTTFKRLQQLMAAKQWDEFDRLLDGKLTSMLYPRYNRDYLRLNSYLLREDHERASEMFDLLLGLNLPKMQRVDLVIKAFNYYVGQEDRKKSKELLHEIKGFEGGQAEAVAHECQLMYDTMILHYLLDPESRHNMDALAMRYLNYRPISITSLIGKGARQLTMDMISLERVAEYAAEDADVTLRLKQVLWPQVEQLGLGGLYLEVEEPMIAVLAEIETAGVRIDSEALAEYAVELNKTLNDLESEIRRLADEPSLNVNSARQLGEVLFGKLRIAEKPKMTRTKQFSTEEEYLQTFAHKYEIVDKILEYRGVKKLLSTYVEALPLLVNPATGKIHTSFNQAVTATGRLSSTNPNLQNIPVRDELGRRIRKAFIPSDDEHLLLSADYSQVELRLMAHLSGDESLIAAFEHGEDVHAATAARLFGKEVAEVDSDERRKAKTANFGIIYGISAFGLSQRLDIPRKEAKEIIEGYFASYPKVKEYMDRVVEEAKRDGYVSTIFGRRRYLNDIASRNAVARGLAERNAVNAPIQGSAADIMKIAMIRVSRRFREEGIRSKVILQVHDELVVDMLRSEQERVIAIVTEAMESAAALRVRLVVDCGVGDNWLEAH